MTERARSLSSSWDSSSFMLTPSGAISFSFSMFSLSIFSILSSKPDFSRLFSKVWNSCSAINCRVSANSESFILSFSDNSLSAIILSASEIKALFSSALVSSGVLRPETSLIMWSNSCEMARYTASFGVPLGI